MKQGIDYIGVSVGAFILNTQREIFLMKRSQKVKNQRGCWEAPGGAIEFGETLKDAVKREVREELGVEIEIIEQFPAEDEILLDEKQHWVPTTFLVRFKKGQIPKIMEPEKCDEIGWFDLNLLPNPLSFITQLNLKRYKSMEKFS